MTVGTTPLVYDSGVIRIAYFANPSEIDAMSQVLSSPTIRVTNANEQSRRHRHHVLFTPALGFRLPRRKIGTSAFP